jgi:hypothetical protein
VVDGLVGIREAESGAWDGVKSYGGEGYAVGDSPRQRRRMNPGVITGGNIAGSYRLTRSWHDFWGERWGEQTNLGRLMNGHRRSRSYFPAKFALL